MNYIKMFGRFIYTDAVSGKKDKREADAINIIKAKNIEDGPEFISHDNDTLMISQECGRTVFTFRGSNDAKDWLNNFDFRPIEEGKTIHDGFYDSWVRFKTDVESRIKDGNTIICIGHSRGAALATLCARHIAKNLGKYCELVTFGSPAVGTDKFRDEFNTLPIEATRIRNGWDLVCALPPEELSFYHVGDEYVIHQPFFHKLMFFRIRDHLGYYDMIKKGINYDIR